MERIPFINYKVSSQSLTKFLYLFLSVSFLVLGTSNAYGGEDDYSVGGSSSLSSIAQREMARRSGLVNEADQALLLGREAYAQKNYQEAYNQYNIAVNMLPPGHAMQAKRKAYSAHLSDASVALAQQYRRTGKYAEARNVLESVLVHDPSNASVRKQLEYLDDPIRTNPALNYKHTQDVDRVRRYLYIGEGYFNIGRYDEAEVEFKKVLRIDRYNKAARRWLERVAAIKSDYYRAAYDHTRAELLKEVDRAWEIAVPPESLDLPIVGPTIDSQYGVQYIQQKLNNIIIPVVNFDGETVEEALDFLRLRARELDTEPDESRKGLNFIIRKPTSSASSTSNNDEASLDAGATSSSTDIASLRIDELKLRNVPLGSLLQYICDKTRLRYKIDEHAVILLPLSSKEGFDFYTRSFIVPPDFISKLSDNSSGGGGENDDPFAPAKSTGADALGKRPKARELLGESGVDFPDGSFVNHIPASSTLIVKNTLSNLETIESIIEAIRGKGPRQVRIMTKFVEVSQENSDELGFDWIINPFQLSGSDTFLSGGSISNAGARTVSDFADPTVATGAPLRNMATAGNRTGDFAITRNNIDSLLNNPNRTADVDTVAPGILSLTGLFSGGQMQMIMRGLSQKKGADIMSAPSVLARSGEKATLQVIREFIYPTEYEPPELPNDVDSISTSGGIFGGTSSSVFPVTPATPTAFETRNTGVTLEVEPTIGENNYTIDLRFVPEIVEFEGFINYGSPIQSPGTDALGNVVQLTITENRIEMPVFSTRRVNTALTIYDGYTVAVGGLMREDVQNVEDKVPILGDLPIIGRLFQTKAENHIKSNLIIFVTAEIIDAAGARINSRSGGIGGSAGLGGGGTIGIDSPSLLQPISQ